MPSDYKAITKYNEEQLGRDTASRKTQISMYSDSTHFVYEILQNADDYGAKEVFFKLSEKELWIEHDGEPFIEDNVKAITYFGQSTSREDLVKTGRFGVGFKSVFAFTATPIIISGCEHFQIYGLYHVKEYPYPDDLPRSRTRIILPFNHESEKPDYVEHLMSQAEAYSKIEARLTSLNKNTLLFTRKIQEIRWETNDRSGHYLREDDISDSARMTTITDGEHLKKYLVFSREPIWEGKIHKAVDVAFSINEKGAVVSAEEDFLYVLFATTQETHLKFILNGPYRTNPARETISEDDPFNEYLLKETCDLVKEVLPQIRQRGLLTTEFLAVLPNRNDDDRLKDFYEPIMDRLVEAFKNEQLIPMKQGGHAPATDVFRGSAQLSDLIDDKDLARILGDGHSSPLWIKNPQSHSREGHFLSMLEIKKWTTQDLIDELSEESEMIMKWLARKNYDWHRRLYVLLLDELNGLNKSLERTYWYEDGVKQKRKDKLLNLCIIRCSDKKYRKGKDCFFPSDGLKNDEEFPLVAKRLYSSGKDENQRNRVLEFLKEMEVKDVEESDRIKAILKQRYSKGSIVSNPQDIKNFIAFAEKEPDKADMFKNYYIFELERQDGRWWGKPKIVFLDSPYLDTGLRAYYEALDDDTGRKWALSPKYKESGIEEKKIGEFAKKVGAQTELEVKEQKIPYRHPKRDYLFSAPGERRRNEIDLDYTIPAFRVLLDKPNVDKARLIWRRMDSLSSIYLIAKYRKSERGGFRCADSSLVYDLRKAKWVPQEDGKSLRFVRPCDASNRLLPEDFSHHPRREWIRKVEFGENARKKSEDHIALTRNAREMGFDNADDAKKWAELKKMGISPDSIRSKFMPSPEFPTSSVSNPERRQERLTEQLQGAPEKKYESKQRSVRTTRGEIDPRTYLKNRYTNYDDQMICQICQKEMPFKKRDGEYYFETVEALSKDYFTKEHEAQFIALCPLCAAMYKEFVIRNEDAMTGLHRALKDSDDLEVPLKLGELETSIRFVQTHRQDMKTILHKEANEGGTP